MQKPAPSPLVEVTGSPTERGRQYGEQARDRIRRGIEHYTEQLAGRSLTWDDIGRLALQFEPIIEAFDKSYTEEMRGIAEGAAVDYAGVMMLNARTEILKLGERAALAGKAAVEPDGCTGVVVLPSASADGRVIHAQNWDWKAECAETTVVLKVRRDDGPDYLTFTEAGALARSGMNAAGISITANYLECDRDYRNLGVPLPFIRRKVLEKALVGEAMHVVYTTAKSCSNNMMISHSGGVAIDFECAPDETFLVMPQGGLLIHANHFQSPVALGKIVEKGVRNMPDSLYRDMRVEELLRPHLGRIRRDEVVHALLDDYQTPWSVCRPPRPSMVNNLTATVATIVMEPEEGRMNVAMLPALYPEFTGYQLDVEIEKADAEPARAAVFV
jgi:isopenicillin-N N-acyltransferase-like protein